MHGHFDVAFVADRHQPLKEVAEVVPEFLLCYRLVLLKQLVKLRHALRLPAGEGHVVFLGQAHDVVRHFFRIVLDHVLLIEQRR